MKKIKAISLFSSAGIGELLLKNTNVEVVSANELLPKRADCYKHFYPNTEMFCGDITLDETKEHKVYIIVRFSGGLAGYIETAYEYEWHKS
ncbi:MAG: DNA cytosine methyltransferase [Clostridiales bacterium]|nr:DNA cytosine methyltransferase [Clostridiales bacterium]